MIVIQVLGAPENDKAEDSFKKEVARIIKVFPGIFKIRKIKLPFFFFPGKEKGVVKVEMNNLGATILSGKQELLDLICQNAAKNFPGHKIKGEAIL